MGHDISTTYRRQVANPRDAIREREEAARREELEAYRDIGPQPHEAASAFATEFDGVLDRAGAVDFAQQGNDAVNAAISQAVQAAGARVEHAAKTPAQKAASAFVDELEARGHVLGNMHFHSDDSDPEWASDGEATSAEAARLEAELEQSGDDDELGYDARGNMMYRDSVTGEPYVLVDEEAA